MNRCQVNQLTRYKCIPQTMSLFIASAWMCTCRMLFNSFCICMFQLFMHIEAFRLFLPRWVSETVLDICIVYIFRDIFENWMIQYRTAYGLFVWFHYFSTETLTSMFTKQTKCMIHNNNAQYNVCILTCNIQVNRWMGHSMWA